VCPFIFPDDKAGVDGIGRDGCLPFARIPCDAYFFPITGAACMGGHVDFRCTLALFTPRKAAGSNVWIVAEESCLVSVLSRNRHVAPE